MIYKNTRGYSRRTAANQDEYDAAVRSSYAARVMEQEKMKEKEKTEKSEDGSRGGGRKESEKQASGGEIVKNAIYSGLNRFNKGLAATADFLLPTEFLGEYDVVSKINDYYSGQADKYDTALEESTSDRSKLVQRGAKLLSDVSEAAPNALLAVMTGGSSAATQGSTAALGAASAVAGKTAAANAIQQTVKNPLYWFSAAQTIGNNYEGAKENGASELQATGSAFTSSLLNAAIETGGGLESLPNVLKQGSITPATAWAKSALTEGLEEPVQSAVSGASEKLFFDKDKPMVSLTDRSAVINPGRMAEEFAAGAAVGGILGAGQLAGTRLAAADPMGRAWQGDYSGLIQKLDQVIHQKKLKELEIAYKTNIAQEVQPQTKEPKAAEVHEFNDQSEYSEWLASIGAADSDLNTIEKYSDAKYNNSLEYRLLSGYGKAVGKGDISPLVGFKEYGLTNQLLQESVIGTVTSTGVKVESFATHFIDRVIGQTSTTHPGMRCGVPVEDVVDALENPLSVGPVRRMKDGDLRQKYYGANASVVVSVRDKKVIQTNPQGGK